MAKRAPNLDFMRPQQPSPELAAIVGTEPLPRSEVTKLVWAYVKKQKLQDKRERRFINADEKLLPIFGQERLSMFEMSKAINKHLTAVSTMPATNEKKNRAQKTETPAADPATAETIQEDAPVAVLFDSHQLEPWPGLNPRKHFDPEKVAELTESIRENGILQPVLAHDRGADFDTGGRYGTTLGPRYWIVAGETRWRAAKATGRKVPAIVRVLTEAQALKFAVLENVQRNDLTPIEEARGLKRMLDLDPQLTQEELGRTLGKSQSYVANRIRLLDLPDSILELVEKGTLSVAAARDCLVPFAKVTEPYRTKLFKDFLKESRDDPDEDSVAWTIGRIARGLSRSLSKNQQGWQDPTPLFDVDLHKECDCSGPSFAYDGGRQRYKRCFNIKWWDAKQAEAEKQLKAAKKADQEKAQADAENAAGSSRASVLTYVEFIEQYGYSRRPIREEDLDASQLANAEFVIVAARHMANPTVYCVDDLALSRARRPANAYRNQLLKEKRAERTARDLAEARAAQIEPWMLGELLHARPSSDKLIEIARELGIAGNVKQSEIYTAVRKLAHDDVALLFKLCAIRSKKDELFRDPIESQIAASVKRKFGPGARALEKRLLEGVEIPESTDDGDDDEDIGNDEAECIECGRTDSDACDDGCSWLAVDRDAGIGVCSQCAADKEEAEQVLAATLAEAS